MSKTIPQILSLMMLAIFFSFGLLVSTSWADTASSKLDINTASLEQLEAIQGVGHDTATNILAYKEEHGEFKTLDDLEQVKGVGKVRLEALREAFMVASKKSTEK